MNPHVMQIQQMYGGHASPFAQARAKRQEQKASLTNPFIMPDQELMKKQIKEENFMPDEKPWLQQDGMFGMNRQQGLMGGLGMLAGLY